MEYSFCRFSRLVYSEKARKRFVGCVKFSSISDLENADYIWNGNEVAFGTIYTNLPPDVNPEEYDTADAHLLALNNLLVHKNSFCDFFQER